MKVRELIEALERCEPDAYVRIGVRGWDYGTVVHVRQSGDRSCVFVSDCE